jgi:ubiquinone biosynthesis protein UbiJ
VLVRPAPVDAFAAEVVRLRDDVERTAKRIAKLEQRLGQVQTQAPSQTPAALDAGRPTVIVSPDKQ